MEANTKTEQLARKALWLRPISTVYKMRWTTFASWRDAFLLFWVFSLVGHILEFAWASIPFAISGMSSHITKIPLIAIAAPYGLGALALIWTVYPLLAKGKIGVFWVFVLSAVIATAVEFICAAIIVLWLGHNPFWNYSGEPFNLFGFVCLRNAIAFGVVSVPMLYWVFPYCNNLLRKITVRWRSQLNASFWVLAISYFAIQIWVIWFKH